MAAKWLQNFQPQVSTFPHKSPRPCSRFLLLTPRPSIIVPETRRSSLSVAPPRRRTSPMMRRSYESYGGFDYLKEESEYWEQLEFPMNINRELATGNIGSSVGYYSSMSCWISSKLELFGPSLFGMKPDPPPEYWPEEEEARRSAEFAIEVNRSRRRGTLARAKGTRQTYYWRVAGDFSYCSVRKVFSLTVFMIRELLSYVLSIRECLYSEDLRKVIDRVQMEMHYTFVWLFGSVFATTPTLMVAVMLLLANFTAHSMAGTAEMAAALPRMIRTSAASGLVEEGADQEECGGEEEEEVLAKMLTKMVALEGRLNFDEATMVNFDEASMVTRTRSDNLACQNESTSRYFLLLLNSALFSNPNHQLHDRISEVNRVEEFFKRAITVEPWDAEVRALYADFLWLIKEDLAGAEETYLEAAAVEASYKHNYATFLLETGSRDICFPLYDFGTNSSK